MGLEDEISRMIWEGSPVSGVTDPKPRNSQYPERVGRIKPASLPDVISDPAKRSIEEMKMAGKMGRLVR